jgi:hypothetical protein
MAITGRNWYEVFLLILTALWAIAGWVTGSEGQEIALTFPAWARDLWYGGLLVCSLVALAGVVAGTVTGLLIERAALFFLAGLCGGYGLVFFANAGIADPVHAAYVVVLVLAYAGVNLTRALQVRRDLDLLRRGLCHLAGPEGAPAC